MPVCANDPQKVTDLEAPSFLSAGLHGLLLGRACHFLTNCLRSCYYLSSPDQAYLLGIQTRNPSGHPPDSDRGTPELFTTLQRQRTERSEASLRRRNITSKISLPSATMHYMDSGLCEGINAVMNVHINLIWKVMTSPSQLTAHNTLSVRLSKLDGLG